ncbi:unnamed protein product, partial [Laminaria digitata]
GLCVEPRNADLKKNLKEIEELIRADKVNSRSNYKLVWAGRFYLPGYLPGG